MPVKELLGIRYAHLAQAHKAHAVDLLDKNLNGEPTIQKLYDFGG